jgi:thiosulfate/3-mercaptopyruvate sulfurtransferase
MRSILGLALLMSGPTTLQRHSDNAAKSISPAEAVTRINQQVSVEMFVTTTKDRLEKRGEIYLDSEKDFRDPKNLGVVITRTGAAKFRDAKIDDPAAHFLHKTIRVTGAVIIKQRRSRIEIDEPIQIQIIERPGKSPAGDSEGNKHASSKSDLLIEPEDLQKMLNRPELRILDARTHSEYAKGHIPGAIHVDVKSWQQLGSKEAGFHDANAWGDQVGQLGISVESRVVVYGSKLPDTARVWWTLKYLGLQHVSILDGGWELWLTQARPTATAATKVDQVKFAPMFQADRLEEFGSLRKSLTSGKVTVIDTRSAEEFTGKEVRGKRGGHIPGAKLLEWKELLTADGRFKPPDQLRSLFRERGIRPDQSAVTC